MPDDAAFRPEAIAARQDDIVGRPQRIPPMAPEEITGEALAFVKSLRRARTVIEVPMDLTERAKGESKAFRLKNVVDVLRTLKVLCAVELGRDTHDA